MDALNLFKLNDRAINFHLVDSLQFFLNEGVVNFKLNAVTLSDGTFRLLEDGDIRLLEDGTFRLLE